ncbi:MAG: CoA pyrophosphatase [Nitrospirae bacterium]|nr:CoA pyrophosphatase [Nitrospirota bacterium]
MTQPFTLADEVRRSLRDRPVQRLATTKLCRAAVLLPILSLEDQPHILFTVRTDTVEHHKGQISFPGGVADSTDVHLTDTVLRETEEEIGVKSADIVILGRLDDQPTPSGFCISPFVGWIKNGAAARIRSEVEIREIFTAPIAALRNPAIYHEDPPVHVDLYTFTIPHYQFGSYDIWGATGRILRQFFDEGLVEDAPR